MPKLHCCCDATALGNCSLELTFVIAESANPGYAFCALKVGAVFGVFRLVGRRIEALASRNGAARQICVFAPFLTLLTIVALAPAKAQVAVTGAPTSSYNYSGDTINLLSPTPIGQHSLNDKPVRDYQGLPLEGWNLYPSLFLGAAFDDNLYQMSTNRVSAAGLNLRPSFLAERDVKKWKFKPGYKNGTPVTVQATIEVNFRLL